MSACRSSPPVSVKRLSIAEALELDILQSKNEPPQEPSAACKMLSPITLLQKGKGSQHSCDGDTSSTAEEDDHSLDQSGIDTPLHESPPPRHIKQLGISMPSYESTQAEGVFPIKAKNTSWNPFTISSSGSYERLGPLSLNTHTENKENYPGTDQTENCRKSDLCCCDDHHESKLMNGKVDMSPKSVAALGLLQSEINEMDSLVDDSSLRSEGDNIYQGQSLYQDHKALTSKDEVELSTDNVTALTLFHYDNDELDSLDDGSSTCSEEDEIDQYLGPRPNQQGLRGWLRRFSTIKKRQSARRMGIQPALYELPEGEIAQAPLSIVCGMEINISGNHIDKASLKLPLDPTEPRTLRSLLGLQDSPEVESTSSSSSVSDQANHEATSMVQLASHISQFDITDDCSTRTGSTCTTVSGDADRIELLMPRFDMPKSVIESQLENVLRPWQVDFLGAVGITTCEQLVEEKESREAELVQEMREWRLQHGMKSYKASQCDLALYIWTRSCKTFLRKNIQALDQEK